MNAGPGWLFRLTAVTAPTGVASPPSLSYGSVPSDRTTVGGLRLPFTRIACDSSLHRTLKKIRKFFRNSNPSQKCPDFRNPDHGRHSNAPCLWARTSPLDHHGNVILVNIFWMKAFLRFQLLSGKFDAIFIRIIGSDAFRSMIDLQLRNMHGMARSTRPLKLEPLLTTHRISQIRPGTPKPP